MKVNRFEYKGNLYKIIDDNSYYKDSDIDMWVSVIVYKSLKDRKTYVRDILDFDIKFKQLSLSDYIKYLIKKIGVRHKSKNLEI